MVKIYYIDSIKTLWVFTASMCPKRGPTNFMVLLEVAQDTMLNLDKIYDKISGVDFSG